jgi:hypothetical protein
MNNPGPRIIFSEWLPTGIVVHFEGGVSIFFLARTLYEQREAQPNLSFHTTESSHTSEL